MKAFAALVRKAGLGPIGLHTLRHTWSSINLAAGANPRDIADAGGHRLDVLMSRYAHALPGGREALAARFEQVMDAASKARKK